MVECEYDWNYSIVGLVAVLIDTWWNVNIEFLKQALEWREF